ncbi:unnamed protein product, partial [Choristocarpus tenellus]
MDVDLERSTGANATSEEDVVASDNLAQERVRRFDFAQDEAGGIDLTHTGVRDFDLAQEGRGGMMLEATISEEGEVAISKLSLEGVKVNAIVPEGIIGEEGPTPKMAPPEFDPGRSTSPKTTSVEDVVAFDELA